MDKRPATPWAIMVLFWLCFIGISTPSVGITISDDTQHLSLGKHLKFFEDTEDIYTFDQISHPTFQKHFQHSQVDVLNFGHTQSSYWIAFSIHHKKSATQPTSVLSAQDTWILELGFAALNIVTLYEKDNATGRFTHREIGYAIPMSEREIPHHNFVFPLTVHRGEHIDYFLKVSRKGGAVQVPLTLSSLSYHEEYDAKIDFYSGIYYGIILAMILYNFFLMVSVGGKSYLYYILYISGLSGTILCMSGYGYLYLWPEHPEINQRIPQLFATFAVLMGVKFIQHFLKVKRYSLRANSILQVFEWIGWLIILSIILSPHFHSEPNVIYANVASLVMPFIAYYCWRNGSRPAAFFLVAWTMLFIGVITYTFSLLGIIESNTFTNYGIQVGAILEVILLSLGLADRINWERKQKFQALQDQHDAVLKLKKTEDQLLHKALHSSTTGLPNRIHLEGTIERYMEEHPDQHLGLFLISLNRFHEFNKTFGHTNGNKILSILTTRLTDATNDIADAVTIEHLSAQKQCVAKAEGTSFAFSVRLHSEFDAATYADQVISAMERPFEFQEMTFEIESTIGISVYPDHGKSVEELLRNAQIALDSADITHEKAVMYSSSIDPYSAKRLSLIGELRQAIENNDLSIHLQPQINLQTQQLTGAEVLIRWTHAEYGFIPPDEFIPLAERTGVIHPLTQWICKTAFEALERLKQHGIDLTLSINISACNLQDKNFKDNVLSLCHTYNTPTSAIILELTETAMMVNPDEALRITQELSDKGIKLSIDDFGTGYSSMAYLKQLPVKELKIDRSFVMDMVSNQDDRTIVVTLLQMGHNMDLEIVAEGIEDHDTLSLLTQLGCNIAQGYYIARPMPVDDFIRWCVDNRTTYPTKPHDQSTSTSSPLPPQPINS